MKVFVAHSEWSMERRASLRSLLAQLPDAVVVSSKVKEHARTWSERLWKACAEYDGDAVCLNDDVEPCPNFVETVSGMLARAKSDVISLHTTLPVAPSLAHAGQRFLQSYLVSGPGYVLRRGVAADVLHFAGRLNPNHRATAMEDNILSYRCWSHRRPAWATIPALVKHDVGLASTAGFDDHPDRQSKVPWDLDVFGDGPIDWTQANVPAFLEVGWMPTDSLAATEIAWLLGIVPGHCWACKERKGEVGAPKTGLMLCAMCGVGLGGAAANVLIDWRTRVGKALKDKKAEEDAARSSKLIAPTPAPIPQDILTRRA